MPLAVLIVGLIIELLLAAGFFLFGVGAASNGMGHLIDSLSDTGLFQWLGSIDWSAAFSWFHSAPTVQMTPQLSFGNEALYTQFQQLMDSQFQIGEMKRTMLTMPALPNEGM